MEPFCLCPPCKPLICPAAGWSSTQPGLRGEALPLQRRRGLRRHCTRLACQLCCSFRLVKVQFETCVLFSLPSHLPLQSSFIELHVLLSLFMDSICCTTKLISHQEYFSGKNIYEELRNFLEPVCYS